MTGNLTAGYGGALYIRGYANASTGDDSSSAVTVTNSTLAGNRAYRTGGVYLYRAAAATILNAIVWGNEDVQHYPQLASYAWGGNTPVFDVRYSDIEDGDTANPGLPWPGEGNIAAPPGFADPRPAAAAPVAGGDYRLTPCSGVVDAGTNDLATYPSLPPDDMDGIGRPWGGGCDMGAYELDTAPSTSSGPFAMDDGAGTDEDSPVDVPVFFNDTLTGTGPQGFGLPVPPAHGTAVWNVDGTMTYTPDPHFNGTDVFFYSFGDESCTAMGQVTVTVAPMPDPPFEVCTSGCGYSSIQAAIDDAWHGDTVRLHPGRYVETINFLGKAITVESADGPETTIIDGGGSGPVVTFNTEERHDSVLKGLTVMNGNTEKGAGIYINGRILDRINEKTTASPTIRGCVVRDNTAVYGGAGIFVRYGSPLIEDSVIRDNTCDGAVCDGGGIWFNEDRGYELHPVIRRSVISGNFATSGGGMYSSGDMVVENTIISGNVASLYGGGISGGGLKIRHSTISGNRTGIYIGSGTVEITNSIVYGNGDSEYHHNIDGRPNGVPWPEFLAASVKVNFSNVPVHGYFYGIGTPWPVGEPWPGTGNINADPQFIDPVTWIPTADLRGSTTSEGNLHLSPLSPCIDAGTDDTASYPWLPADDIDSDQRPQGAARDMGADEHVFHTPGDWDHDGSADLLWRAADRGLNIVSYFEGQKLLGWDFMSEAPAPWTVGAAADFNLDGNMDIVWTNSLTGVSVLAYYQGLTMNSFVRLPSTASAWRLAGSGDFDGDRIFDLVWANDRTGQNEVWYLNTGGYRATAKLPSAPSPWRVIGVGDFDRDGGADLLVRSGISGQVVIVYMNATNRRGFARVANVGVSRELCGVMDLSGDGEQDLIWRDPWTGENEMWTLSNGARTGTVPLPTVPAPWLCMTGAR